MLKRFGLMLLCVAALGQTHRVAITIDDLPRGGDGGPGDLAGIRAMTVKLLRPFKEQKIPLIGFVNEGRTDMDKKGLREILDLWLDAGADLGNHAYSHPDINDVPLDEYTSDIVKGETITREVLTARGKTLQYFRHPYLRVGSTPETKRGLQSFLDQHGYKVAPVTFDDSDYEYAALYMRPEFHDRVKKEYVPYMESIVAFFEQRAAEVTGHDLAQILLIHASQMNADLMPDLLAMFKRRGYAFITLDEALKDPAYKLPDNYVGRGGFSWIHRWPQPGGKGKGEPDPPAWVTKAAAELRNQ